METSISGADYLLSEFARAGIQMAFGFPGESTLPLYSAFKRTSITHVMARCERCAGYMADAYARLTRSVALCDAPGGIGSPHVLPALNEAYNSAIPLIMLTTATADASTYRWATSHCKHEEMFAPVVKEVFQIHSVQRLGELARRAVNIATSGRPGPVHIDIDTDLLVQSVVPAPQQTAQAQAHFPRFRSRPDKVSLLKAARILEQASQPLLVAGGGALLSGAEVSLELFARAFQVPVATTFNGKGTIAETHPLSIGVIGAKGNVVANQLASEADVILWLGSKAGDKSTSFGSIPARGTQVIQVDIAPEEHGRTFDPAVALCADISASLDDLYDALGEGKWQAPLSWKERASTLTAQFRQSIQEQVARQEQMTTVALVNEIQRRYADNAVIVADASRACSWVGAFYTTGYAGRSVLAPRGSGSIGYALPATIAAALACPDRLAIGIGGDGGFAMACHELETAVRLGTRFVFIILNNNSLGLLNQVASVHLQEPQLLGVFAPTDWEAIARGFGCESSTITSLSQLSIALDRASLSRKPTILNALLPASEVSPDFQMFMARNAPTAL